MKIIIRELKVWACGSSVLKVELQNILRIIVTCCDEPVALNAGTLIKVLRTIVIVFLLYYIKFMLRAETCLIKMLC